MFTCPETIIINNCYHQNDMRLHTFLTTLMLLSATCAMAQTQIYSWQSPTGTVVETGGTLDHINQNGRDLRNIKCADYYTFVLNGDVRYIDAGYNVDECSYMKLTLADGGTFREGDEIEITAMRNNVADRPASICLLFDNTSGTGTANAAIFDNNVWNNLGMGKDDTFTGGTERSPRREGQAQSGEFIPSTYTFVVPKDADGADCLRLTRYATGNLLYVSRLAVTRPAGTAISMVSATRESAAEARKYADGNKGLFISRGEKRYRVNGTMIK